MLIRIQSKYKIFYTLKENLYLVQIPQYKGTPIVTSMG